MFAMRDESKDTFLIIKLSASALEIPREVVSVVKGKGRAENAVERFDKHMSGLEREAGWGHIYQKTTSIKAGTTPELANKYYHMELAVRKAKTSLPSFH